MSRLKLRRLQRATKLDRRRARSLVAHAVRALTKFGKACWLVATWRLRATAKELGISDPIEAGFKALAPHFPEVRWEVTWGRGERRWTDRNVAALVQRETRQVPVEVREPVQRGRPATASLSMRYALVRGELYVSARDFSRWFLDETAFTTILDTMRMMAQEVIRYADAAEQKQMEAQLGQAALRR